ncbi:extracellular solute-binding protein [Amycolatopsis jejuensis]|uniref:extracellular solute-binding protein n=1 Tax=Amycolatopsis jejuensis TaxID=330084 RepID=UPI00068D136B|nr:extracellular solute-binding protein [Amycolatopsis jejuensis]
MNPRWMGVAAAATTVMLVTSACGGSGGAADSGGKSFTFAGFGGALQDSQAKAWFTPFGAAHGVTVNQTANSGVAALQTQVQSGSVQWDVVEDAQFQADSGCGTLYEKIPDVDRSAIEPKFVTNECGVPVVKFSFVLAYNSNKYPKPPVSVGDLVNAKDFPGKRGVSDKPVDGVLEAALLGDGVAPDALYPLDYRKAIAKLGSIKGDLVFKSSYAELQDGLVSGNLDLALLPNGRAYDAAKLNPAVKVAWTDAITLYDNALLVKGAPNAALGKTFLGYLAKPDTQAALSKVLPYGVLTSGTPPKLAAEVEPFFPDNPAHSGSLRYQDQKWWAQNQDAVTTAWTGFVSG